MTTNFATGTQAFDAATERLARQLPAAMDSNKDGPISTQEFGDFLTRLLPNLIGGGGALARQLGDHTVNPTRDFTPIFRGFDASRAQSAAGSLKYDAYNVLQDYDPRDPTAM